LFEEAIEDYYFFGWGITVGIAGWKTAELGLG
jgi:hypothetical protein